MILVVTVVDLEVTSLFVMSLALSATRPMLKRTIASRASRSIEFSKTAKY